MVRVAVADPNPAIKDRIRPDPGLQPCVGLEVHITVDPPTAGCGLVWRAEPVPVPAGLGRAH